MKYDLDSALDQCLADLRGGMDIESCLAQYPEHAQELRPLLQLVSQVGRVITPALSPAAQAAGQQLMLETLTVKHEREGALAFTVRAIRRTAVGLVPGKPRTLAPAMILAAVILVFTLVLSSGVAFTASADSLPGDMLYPMKLASQRVQIALSLDEARQQQLEEQYEAQQRLDVQAALVGGRQAEVSFRGILESIEAETWVVGGMPVTLQVSTEIVGQPSLGTLVQVEGTLPGSGDLLATWLQVEPGIAQEPSQTPTPSEALTPTETPEPSDTPQPTATAEPTQSPEPTSTPEPTETEEESSEATVTRGTRVQEATPEPVDTPEPGRSPEPTEEPKDTPEPGHEPEPTETPEPEDTPEREVNPEPTDTPEPEDTPDAGDESEPTDTPEEPEDEEETEGTSEPADDPEPEEIPEDSEPEEDPSEDPEPRKEREEEEKDKPTEEPDD